MNTYEKEVEYELTKDISEELRVEFDEIFENPRGNTPCNNLLLYYIERQHKIIEFLLESK